MTIELIILVLILPMFLVVLYCYINIMKANKDINQVLGYDPNKQDDNLYF